MSDDRGDGPSFQNLLRLRDMLPSFIQGMEEKRLTGKGTSARASRPTKSCTVCGAMFDHKVADGEQKIDVGLCDNCWEHLSTNEERQENGSTKVMRGVVFRHGEYYCFLVSSNLGDMAGKIVDVNEMEWTQIAKQFQIQQRAKNAANQKGQSDEVA